MGGVYFQAENRNQKWVDDCDWVGQVTTVFSFLSFLSFSPSFTCRCRSLSTGTANCKGRWFSIIYFIEFNSAIRAIYSGGVVILLKGGIVVVGGGLLFVRRRRTSGTPPIYHSSRHSKASTDPGEVNGAGLPLAINRIDGRRTLRFFSGAKGVPLPDEFAGLSPSRPPLLPPPSSSSTWPPCARPRLRSGLRAERIRAAGGRQQQRHAVFGQGRQCVGEVFAVGRATPLVAKKLVEFALLVPHPRRRRRRRKVPLSHRGLWVLCKRLLAVEGGGDGDGAGGRGIFGETPLLEPNGVDDLRWCFCLFRLTPTTLHSVPLPLGPRLHSGVCWLPHAMHCRASPCAVIDWEVWLAAINTKIPFVNCRGAGALLLPPLASLRGLPFFLLPGG